ncbi:hypothetical protein roselon_01906 [Roseibacterium elongatum DSM 19469]|uniref:Uncharacterized protein n=1 Tax=Roseicyclus elongatus DSM 19469 TaxID=1294273 RepID=W8SP06_9RHOB|nr:hypothetical protein roselon_01906 [Roseibacterium elongatum DSM 19469]
MLQAAVRTASRPKCAEPSPTSCDGNWPRPAPRPVPSRSCGRHRLGRAPSVPSYA